MSDDDALTKAWNVLGEADANAAHKRSKKHRAIDASIQQVEEHITAAERKIHKHPEKAENRQVAQVHATIAVARAVLALLESGRQT